MSLFSLNANANSERVVDYEYDGAGNIVGIKSSEQSAPPAINLITPNFINLGRSVSFTINGDNLLNAEVTTTAVGLVVSDVHADLQQINFRLTASHAASEGEAQITVTTSLGSASIAIIIAAEPPVLTVTPSPLVFLVSENVQNITLTFSEPRPDNETYRITIDNPEVASTTVTELVIDQGQSLITLPITTHARGATGLRLLFEDKAFSFAFPLFVSESFDSYSVTEPSIKADNNLFSDRVGIFVAAANNGLNAVFAQPVGVVVQSTTASNHNLLSLPVGIIVLSETANNHNLISKPVGIAVGNSAASIQLSVMVGVHVGSGNENILSPLIEVLVGPLIDDYVSLSFSAGTVDLIIEGVNLTDVTSVSIVPDDDMTLAEFTVSADGKQLTIPITIASGAQTGERTVKLQSPSGVVVSRSGRSYVLSIE